MQVCLMIDFGSTYTKVAAMDLESEALLGRAQSPTTIETDITDGLAKALENLAEACDFRPEDVIRRYACSSAAGGLKIAAVGLVPELTLKAAQRAALGAGAKILCAYGYEIDKEIVGEIEAHRCDIVLLCGGTDGGNKNVIEHNAEMLADSAIACPILVCGNRAATHKAKDILETGGKRVYTAKNVLPAIDRVEVEPAQALIRDIFIDHIVKAKGLGKAKSFVQRDIIPTPMASLWAAALLADGAGSEPGIGSLLVVEVGGATTNIHSVEDIKGVTPQTVVKGLPESRVSRTVEGDMGIRYNARTIFEIAGAGCLSECVHSLDPAFPAEAADPDAYTRLVGEHVGHVPQNEGEALLDIALAKTSVGIATQRHAGYLKPEFTAIGEVFIQYGKNLLDVRNVIGTGGVFKYGKMPEAVLASAVFSEDAPWSLRPRTPNAWVDSEYILYAIGLLSQEYPEAALRIAKKHLKPVDISGEA
ncbi:MAG: glutamate mutase L [Clostridiales Family XIII bacterium]|jgi:uncharacterized protein (TIGR01319 family)|nr:glutamate mutase L [Clostridiales Family XIII bacterium]